LEYSTDQRRSNHGSTRRDARAGIGGECRLSRPVNPAIFDGHAESDEERVVSSAAGVSARSESLQRVWGWCVALIPLVYLPGLPNGAEWPQAMAAAIVTTFVAAALIWRTPRDLSFAPVLPFAWPAGLLLLLATLSLGWSAAPLEGGKRILGAAVCAMAYLVTSQLFRTAAAVMWVLRALAVSGALMASVGLMQRFAGWDVLPQVAAPAAHFMNRTLAVEVSLVLLPLGLAFRAAAGRPAAIARILTLALPALFVLTSGARMGLLAGLVQGLIAVALLSHRGAPRHQLRVVARAGLLVGLGTVISVVGALAPSPMPGPDPASSAGARARPRADAADSLEVRRELWRAAGKMFESSPWVGVGLGGYALHYRETAVSYGGWVPGDDAEVEAAHNEAVQLGAELGVVGLALGVWFVWGLWGALRPPPESRIPQRDWGLTWAIALISVAGLIVAAGSGYPLQRIAPPFVVAVVFGCLSGLKRATSPPRSALLRPGTPRRTWLPAALVTACSAVVGLGVVTITASAYLHSARQALDVGDFAGATRASRTSLRWAPWGPDAELVLGTALLQDGRFWESREAFERLSRLRPHWVSAAINLASARFATGDSTGAFALFRRAEALAPTSQSAIAGAWMTFASAAGLSQSDAGAPAPSREETPKHECGGFTIRVNGTRLSVAGRGTLHDALTCIGRELGFDVDYSEGAPRLDVPRLDFEDQESLVAIGNLLAEHRLGYAMSLTQDKSRVRSLLVFGAGDPTRPKPPTPPPTRDAEGPARLRDLPREAPPPRTPPRAPARAGGSGASPSEARPGRPQPQPLRFPGPVVPGPVGLTPSSALR
jgi:O-antigen ligase